MLRVGISRHANFFHENLAKPLFIRAAQIALNTQENEQFCLGWPLLLHLLWKTPWKICGARENQKTLVCCALMSSYTTPRHRILRVSKEFAKFAR